MIDFFLIFFKDRVREAVSESASERERVNILTESESERERKSE